MLFAGRMSRPLLSLTTLATLLVSALVAQAESRWVRSPQAFTRDVKRAVGRPTLGGEAIGGKGILRLLGRGRHAQRLIKRLTAARTPEAAVGHFSQANKSRVSLGGGVELAIKTAGTRVEALKVSHKGRRRSLLPRGKARVELDIAPAASSSAMRLDWPGPFSRFSVLAYLHELGHVQHFRQLSAKQRDAIEMAGAFAGFGTPLTSLQKRMILGAERQAWANAFRQLRQVRRAGIPLLSDVPDSTLRRVAHGLLDGYAAHLGQAASLD